MSNDTKKAILAICGMVSMLSGSMWGWLIIVEAHSLLGLMIVIGGMALGYLCVVVIENF